MSDQFSDFLPSLGAIIIGVCLVLLGRLLYGLAMGGSKRGHSALFTIYDKKKDQFKLSGIVGTLFVVGIILALSSQIIASDFHLNIWAVFVFGLFFIISGFIIIAVKIH